MRPERLRRIIEGLGGSSRPVVFAGHPRTRSVLADAAIELPPSIILIDPLGYLDFAALASQAAVIATDSGGLQKEAYWYGVPCVTMRPSTEWIDTVDAGANVLVDDDPALIAAAIEGAEIPAELARRSTATATPPSGSRPCSGVPLRAVHRDVAIIGAGYVGIPLAQVFADAGRSVLLVDVSAERVAQLNRGESYIEDVPSEKLKELVEERGLRATTDYDELREADAIVIALPTPLSKQREPDLSIVRAATGEIATRLRAGPSRRPRVDDLPRHDARRAAADPRARLGPDRRASTSISPSPPSASIPAGSTTRRRPCPRSSAASTRPRPRRPRRSTAARSTRIHRVSTPEAAELTKLLENIFRSVNIALVNELAQLCDRMGIDIWEVVDAAATKPFGFMRFDPGPGLGGHCIPIDPFYLTWKAREFDFSTRFIELAGEVNQNMPYYCRSRVSQALNHGAGKSLKGSRILVLGVAYKADISDMRESPAVKLIELLQNAGADVAYHDPHVPSFVEHGTELVSQPLEPGATTPS